MGPGLLDRCLQGLPGDLLQPQVEGQHRAVPGAGLGDHVRLSRDRPTHVVPGPDLPTGPSPEDRVQGLLDPSDPRPLPNPAQNPGSQVPVGIEPVQLPLQVDPSDSGQLLAYAGRVAAREHHPGIAGRHRSRGRGPVQIQGGDQGPGSLGGPGHLPGRHGHPVALVTLGEGGSVPVQDRSPGAGDLHRPAVLTLGQLGPQRPLHDLHLGRPGDEAPDGQEKRQ